MYLKKGNQIFNVRLVTLRKFRRRTGKCVQPTEYFKSGRFLMVKEAFTSDKGASFQEGWFSDRKPLKCHFQHSRDDSCVKKVP